MEVPCGRGRLGVSDKRVDVRAHEAPKEVNNGPRTKSVRGSAPVGVARADTTVTGFDCSGAIPSSGGEGPQKNS